MQVTEQEIESKKSSKNGWTKKQLSEWGIGWPPPKGWKDALINGTAIPVRVEVKEKKETREEKEWYRYLIHEGFKRIIQVENGKTIYDGSIENLLQ